MKLFANFLRNTMLDHLMVRFFYLLNNFNKERGRKDTTATYGVDHKAATPKRASIYATGALLGLKPSRFFHLITIIVRHAVLIYSSTPL
jgi:hypothetical protein